VSEVQAPSEREAFAHIPAESRIPPVWALPLLMLLFLAVTLAVMVAAGIALTVAGGVSIDGDGPQMNWRALTGFVVAALLVLATIIGLWVVYFERRSLASVGLSRLKPVPVAVWFAAGVGFALATSLAIAYGTGAGEEAAALPEAFGQPGRLLAAGAVLALILLPNSIAEELLFRGWAMSAITRRHGLLPAMVITSAAFGAAHVPPWEWAEPARLLSFVSYSAVGLAFAAMAVRTGSLYAPIAFHTGFNTLLITGAFADADFSPDRMLENITNSPLGTALISEAVVWLVVNLIFAALLVGWWRRRRT
jgi:membrane protease YdiL (CAAX protease family)